MKIVTYNVNGLRQRAVQHGSLLKLLDSFDADIVCFQETKLRKQDLTTDLAMAEGYESFFSCTRTVGKGRSGYSGVATFCRVKSAFSSTEVALPLSAEEGLSGILSDCDKLKNGDTEQLAWINEEFILEDLIKVDGEGRCVITDHGHFGRCFPFSHLVSWLFTIEIICFWLKFEVLFNIYGPRAESNDRERVQFKQKFYRILQRRCECLLDEGRRILVVGDLNIAPTSLDRCDAGPDFESDQFRKWFRLMLKTSGGKFSDCFRRIHPDRRDAYTCWPSNTGAEMFNYGTRIDHILCSGTCLHNDNVTQDHEFINCHVQDCDILTEYKRWNLESTPSKEIRWKGGLNLKLVGSDHAPVFLKLVNIPSIKPHSTPPLSSRYLPMCYGLQQTLDSVLKKRQAMPQPWSGNEATLPESRGNGSVDDCSANSSFKVSDKDDNLLPSGVGMKRMRCRSSQRSLKSFFSKVPTIPSEVNECSKEFPSNDQHSDSDSVQLSCNYLEHEEVYSNCSETGKNTALMEWRRIQRHMQSSLPLCKGHNEPCVSRVVKKPGPTLGQRFYVCARAEGPSSNPETNCGYFKWASLKSRPRQ